MGTRKHKHKYHGHPGEHHLRPPARPSKKCHALCCCSTRLSVSSSANDLGCSPCAADPEHAMVQARLEEMIKGKERRTAAMAARRGSRCVVLVALDKNSYEPREDFRESMLEVITSNGMEEPRELRQLLNCYMSVNPREHRVVILEAFHDVCTSLFTCKF